MPEKISTCLVKAGNDIFSFSKEEIDTVDIVKRSATEFHVIKDYRSVNVKLIDADITAKKLQIEVEGERFDVEIQDELDQMLEKMGFSSVATKHIKDIKAPMPGMVLSISVKEGQEVKVGDRILILEAMKMENSIMIPADAVIKKIKVNAGQPVDKGQVLVELE
jgi:biotin carboxyl carrier protein